MGHPTILVWLDLEFQQEIWMRSKQTPSISYHSLFGVILVQKAFCSGNFL